MGTTKFVYTFSSIGSMPVYLFHSIKSLQQYVSPADIIVFGTPPLNEEDVETLRGLRVDIREREHVSDPFTAFNVPQHYADKLLLTTVDAETVVFFDCDTLVFGDPHQLITGASFRSRVEPAENEQQLERWRQMFRDRNEPVIDWMPNAGVLVFDHRFHEEIADQWTAYVHSELPDDIEETYLKEQYALALAAAGHPVEEMTRSEHVFEWLDEFPPDGIVYHAGNALHRKTSVGIRKEAKMKIDAYRERLNLGRVAQFIP